jgi:ribosomal protein S18 acetylase RimI-like enzyme
MIDDIEAITQLHADSWRHAYRGALSDTYLAGDVQADRRRLWRQRLVQQQDTQHVLVAEQTGNVVGFACAYLGDDDQWGSLLDNIHVARVLHRSGVGSSLLTSVAAHCVRHAPNAGLYLWVLQNNLAAQSFYLRHGADNVGTDVWDAPGGTQVPRFRFAWPADALGRLAAPGTGVLQAAI